MSWLMRNCCSLCRKPLYKLSQNGRPQSIVSVCWNRKASPSPSSWLLETKACCGTAKWSAVPIGKSHRCAKHLSCRQLRFVQANMSIQQHRTCPKSRGCLIHLDLRPLDLFAKHLMSRRVVVQFSLQVFHSNADQSPVPFDFSPLWED